MQWEMNRASQNLMRCVSFSFCSFFFSFALPSLCPNSQCCFVSCHCFQLHIDSRVLCLRF